MTRRNEVEHSGRETSTVLTSSQLSFVPTKAHILMEQCIECPSSLASLPFRCSDRAQAARRSAADGTSSSRFASVLHVVRCLDMLSSRRKRPSAIIRCVDRLLFANIDEPAQLLDQDLALLRYIDARHPTRRRLAFTLYRVADIIRLVTERDAARLRYDSERKAQRVEWSRIEAQVRRRNLVDALGQRGLELRADSQLCTRYIDGADDWTLMEIIDRLETMHVLYCHTRYPVFYDEAFQESRRAREADRKMHGCTWSRLSIWRDALMPMHRYADPFDAYFESAKFDAEAKALAELKAIEGGHHIAETCRSGRKMLRSMLDLIVMST